MTGLRFLYLERNDMYSLPKEMGNLTSLVELDVANAGALLKVPESMCSIRTLETLTVDPTIVIPYCMESRISSHFRIVVK